VNADGSAPTTTMLRLGESEIAGSTDANLELGCEVATEKTIEKK
jgi:hypothetical protein